MHYYFFGRKSYYSLRFTVDLINSSVSTEDEEEEKEKEEKNRSKQLICQLHQGDCAPASEAEKEKRTFTFDSQAN